MLAAHMWTECARTRTHSWVHRYFAEYLVSSGCSSFGRVLHPCHARNLLRVLIRVFACILTLLLVFPCECQRVSTIFLCLNFHLRFKLEMNVGEKQSKTTLIQTFCATESATKCLNLANVCQNTCKMAVIRIHKNR